MKKQSLIHALFCLGASAFLSLPLHAETVLANPPEDLPPPRAVQLSTPSASPEPVAEPRPQGAPELPRAAAVESAETTPATISEPVETQAAPAESATDASPVAAEAAPVEPGDLWQRIRAGFALPPLDLPLVERHSARFASEPAYVERIVERSRRYLYHIVEEVEAHAMPSEIALLPIVESAFNPKAYSRAHASGIWQFIPATGKRYGLSQNWWYDGRRDIMAATGAALDYLQALHNRFGDWHLALAAYNCGEGCVQRAIARNRAAGVPTDFANLRLPTETRHYVPKLLGVAAIVKEPQRYGITLAYIPNERYFSPVATTRHIDVQRAAQFAEISVQEFLDLNPGYNRPVITAHTEQIILVPAEKADFFRANLENPDRPLLSWRAHKLQRGASLDKVATNFGLSASELKRLNGIAQSKRVAGGGTILVPAQEAHDELPVVMQPEAMVPAPLPPVRTLRHSVRRGETLSTIARRYRVSVSQLVAWNHLRGRRVVAGQVLSIHKAGGARYAQIVKAGKRHYTVRRGDSWFSIAKHFNVSVAQLRAWNGSSGRNSLIAGRRIVVRT